jgi:hypothetical protein
MKLLEVMTAAGGRTSGGDPFLWSCFGENANYMEYRDVDGNGYAHCVFDTKTYEVYQIHVEVPLTSNEADAPHQTFQWIDPAYLTSYILEAKEHGTNPDIAYDDVRYTNVYDESTILQYVKDIGEGYYDDLPVPEEKPFTMDMPGTIGGAKITFPEEIEMTERFTVKLDVRYELEVEANSADEAIEKAKYFQETMPKGWGDHDNFDVSWIDTYVVKEIVERDING